MFKINIYTLLFLFLSTLNCKAENDPMLKPSSVQELPESRPQDLVIKYSSVGGMIDISENLYLSKDSCVLTKRRYGNVIKHKFTITENELDKIYDNFRNNKFDEIETHTKKVYDRGGNSVTVDFGDEHFVKSNSGMSFIEDNWETNYGNIVKLLTDISNNVWIKNARDFSIKIHKSINDRDGYIIFDGERIYSGDDQFDSNEKLSGNDYYEVKLKLIDGVYSLNYNFNNSYELKSVDIAGYSNLVIEAIDGKLNFELLK